MVIEARDDIHKLNLRYAMMVAATVVSSGPTSTRATLNDPKVTMQREFDSLQANHTWWLVPCLARANIITSKWVFKPKYNLDGSFDHYKARWVVRGFTQHAGINFSETFTLVVKPATIRTMLTLIALK